MPSTARTLLLAGAAAIGVAAGPATAAHALPPKTPQQIKCKPGSTTKDEAGVVTAVCNKKGQWVKVVRVGAA